MLRSVRLSVCYMFLAQHVPFASGETLAQAAAAAACLGFGAQRFYFKKSKFFGKRVFVFRKYYFLILATRSHNCISSFTPFESSLKVLAKLCIFKFANLNKRWQFWQKCVNRTFVHAVRLD